MIKAHPDYNSQNYNKHKEWHARHNEQYYRTHLDYYINYWDVNSARYNHHTAKRRAAIKQALPPWADLDSIHAVYQECKLITEITGIPHEVDHIVPLQSDLVCGLHWVGNLQIISQTANRKKSNTLS
jgi:5-methylcytosine-specific restriction endonuclease McrA